MLLPYLKRAMEVISSRKLPSHPHATRNWVLTDNTVVVADTTDETELDKPSFKSVCPTITDLLDSGQKLQSIMPCETNLLTASQFAEKFMTQFEYAGLADRSAAAAAAAASAQSQPDVPPTE